MGSTRKIIIFMPKSSFFSLAEMKQPVNQWLCIAFLGVFCFWTVLYYLTEKARAIGETFSPTSFESIDHIIRS